ncbi:unnamed protein product, partial [Effrenium voratum]
LPLPQIKKERKERAMAWHARLGLCIQALASEQALFEDASMMLLQKGAVAVRVGAAEEDAGTAAIRALHGSPPLPGSREEGATGVGIVEEQHAHYLVAADMAEPQVRETFRAWQAKLQQLSRSPWAKALKAKGLRVGRSALQGASEAAEVVSANSEARTSRSSKNASRDRAR